MQSHLFQTKLGVGPAATRQRGGASPGMQSRGFSPTLGTRCFGAFPLFSTSRMISSQPVFAVKLEERESVTVSIRDENSAANPGRLWSNLGKDSNQHEPGSLLGAASLVAGTTVGAGVLALPSGESELRKRGMQEILAQLQCHLVSRCVGLYVTSIRRATKNIRK